MGWFSKKEPEEVLVGGKPLTCRVCGHDRYWRREAQLNTSVATFFGFDWANQAAVCAVCADCGYIHWFMPNHD